MEDFSFDTDDFKMEAYILKDFKILRCQNRILELTVTDR